MTIPRRYGIETDLDREFAAVLASAKQFTSGAHRSRLRIARKHVSKGKVRVAKSFWNQGFDRMPDELATGVPEFLLHPLVDQHDNAVAVDKHDAVRCAVEQDLEFFPRRFAIYPERAERLKRLTAPGREKLKDEGNIAQDMRQAFQDILS